MFSFRCLNVNNLSGKFVNVQPNIMYAIRHCSLFAQHEDCIKCTKSHNFLTKIPLTVYLVYPFTLPPSCLSHEPTDKRQNTSNVGFLAILLSSNIYIFTQFGILSQRNTFTFYILTGTE